LRDHGVLIGGLMAVVIGDLELDRDRLAIWIWREARIERPVVDLSSRRPT
jgi:hypothetical protein